MRINIVDNGSVHLRQEAAAPRHFTRVVSACTVDQSTRSTCIQNVTIRWSKSLAENSDKGCIIQR